MAMALNAIDMKPLRNRLEMFNLVQEGFADNAAAPGELIIDKRLWDQLNQLGPKDGHFLKASKCWLIAKTEKLAIKAKAILAGSNINIISGGQKHLGAVIGNIQARKKFNHDKLDVWIR